MDVRNWPMDRIMQLPDRCFGRRWFVGMISGKEDAGADYIVAEPELPTAMVVWGMYLTIRQTAITGWKLSYRLGPDMVYDAASFDALERVFPNLAHISFLYEIWSNNCDQMIVTGLRNFVEPNGRRLVMAIATVDGTGYREAAAGLLISSIPKEVPDWLLSAKDRIPS